MIIIGWMVALLIMMLAAIGIRHLRGASDEEAMGFGYLVSLGLLVIIFLITVVSGHLL